MSTVDLSVFHQIHKKTPLHHEDEIVMGHYSLIVFIIRCTWHFIFSTILIVPSKPCCCLSKGCEGLFNVHCCVDSFSDFLGSDTFWQLPAFSAYWASAADTLIHKVNQHKTPPGAHILSLVSLFCDLIRKSWTPILYPHPSHLFPELKWDVRLSSLHQCAMSVSCSLRV